jgi:hypothetical protein
MVPVERSHEHLAARLTERRRDPGHPRPDHRDPALGSLSNYQ